MLTQIKKKKDLFEFLPSFPTKFTLKFSERIALKFEEKEKTHISPPVELLQCFAFLKTKIEIWCLECIS